MHKIVKSNKNSWFKLALPPPPVSLTRQNARAESENFHIHFHIDFPFISRVYYSDKMFNISLFNFPFLHLDINNTRLYFSQYFAYEIASFSF